MPKAPFVANHESQQVPGGTFYRKRGSKPAAILKWLKDGNSVNASEPNRETFLHILAAEGNLAAVELLLDHGAAPDPVNGFGMTPLLLALNNDQPAVAALLLDRGANAKHRAKDGRTALHCVMATHVSLVRRLLDGGADPTLTDERGHSAIDRMTFAGEPEGGGAEIVAMMRAQLGVTQSKAASRPKAASKPRPQKPLPKWKAVCVEVWKRQVPARGQSDTVQGELVRAVERLREEALRNGNVNWNADHRRLHRFIGKTLRASGLLTAAQRGQLKEDLNAMGDVDCPPRDDAPYDNVCRLVAAFCEANPEPIARDHDAKLNRM